MRKFSLRTGGMARRRLSASENVATRKSRGLRTESLLVCFCRFFGRLFVQDRMVRALPDHALDLPHRDHGEEADEEQEAGEKEAEAADQDADVDEGRLEHAPARRQERAVERDHDD